VTTRIDTVRILSAIWAGALLAVTPHCGGNSEGQADDSNGGKGGTGYSGAPGTGGSYGGSYGGSLPCTTALQVCLTPAQLALCSMPDGGVDAGADTGAGGTGDVRRLTAKCRST